MQNPDPNATVGFLPLPSSYECFSLSYQWTCGHETVHIQRHWTCAQCRMWGNRCIPIPVYIDPRGEVCAACREEREKMEKEKRERQDGSGSGSGNGRRGAQDLGDQRGYPTLGLGERRRYNFS